MARRKRLAHARIVEGRPVDIEHDVVESPARHLHRLHPLDAGHALEGIGFHLADHVDFAVLQGGDLRGRVGEDPQDEPVEIGPAGSEVARVPLHHHPLVGHELLEHEGAGSEHGGVELAEVGDAALRHDARHGAGQRLGQVGIGRGELNAHRAAIHRPHGGDGAELRLVGRRGLRVEDLLDGGDHVRGAEDRAVVKPDAVAQDEGPRGTVGARGVGLREIALDAAVRGEASEIVVEIDRAPPLVAENSHDGIERAEVLVERHRELPARLGLAVGGASEEPGQDERARARRGEVTGEPATGHAHRSNAF